MCSRRALDTIRLFAVVLLAASVWGCAENVAPPSPRFVTTDPAASQPRTYRLGIGDKLKLSVYGEPELTGALEVNALGNVPVPLIGEVPAKGRSIDSFRLEVGRRLAEGYLKNPKVSIEILSYRPIFVHGEVKTGGEFQYKNGLKLRDAIAMAGGYTYRAHQSYVVLTREGEADEKQVAVTSEFAVLPGDNIRVPERMF